MSHLVQQSIFGEAVQNADVGAFLLNGEIVVAVNDAVANLIGYSLEEIFTGGVPPLAADDDTKRQREEVFAGTRTTGKGRIHRKDGSVISIGYLVSKTRVARDTLMLGLLWAEA